MNLLFDTNRLLDALRGKEDLKPAQAFLSAKRDGSAPTFPRTMSGLPR